MPVWLVEKAAELGVTRLVPLITERSVVKPNEKTRDRLGRWVIEASKQCGRNRLLEIAPVCSWEEWLARRAPRRLIAHAGGRPLEEIDLSRPEATRITIGPEGGLTSAEVAEADPQRHPQAEQATH